jgi:hypothetical protein
MTAKENKMDKYLKDVQAQLEAIYGMTQDDDHFDSEDQPEVDKDDLMLRSLIALSALREYRQRKASQDYIRDGKPTFDLDD